MENSEKLTLLTEKITKIYPTDYQKVLENLTQPTQITSFRFNTLKFDTTSVTAELEKEGFKIYQSSLPLAFYVKNSESPKPLSQSQAFDQKKIYIQGLSSMLPVELLNPKTGEKILDLCAAPGSKTSYISQLTQGHSDITAVENNQNRMSALKRVCTEFCAGDIFFERLNGVVLSKIKPMYLNYFDKILVDAPCSNEASIRPLSENSIGFWNPKLSKKISFLQKKLVASAVSMLKSGGSLVYSTCTYSTDENENVVEWTLKTFKNLKGSEIPINHPELYLKINNSSLRVLPNEYADGFFASVLTKN